ncbi:MAG TPA: hypothetical protein VFJ02_16400 [Vicinamibacterales bacterium]|nr:hypothetical protein [Vicinamibacterales bacterium]
MNAAPLLFGTHIHPADGEAARRQRHALTILRGVSPLPPVNLQFRDRRRLQQLDGFETHAVLEQDSNAITGRPGIRKPLVNEMFTRLAEHAVARGARWFAFTNSDIIVTPDAIDRVRAGDRLAYAFSRTDVDPQTNRELGPLIHGVDAFVVDARWWLEHRSRFRPYIVGESVWDNIYTAQLLCWAGGLLLNREPLVRHETHPIAWRDSPFAEHNGILGALDRMYFSRWVLYANRLEAMRREAGGLAGEQEELRLQRDIFSGWAPDLGDKILQALRVAKLRLRFLGRRAGGGRTAQEK